MLQKVVAEAVASGEFERGILVCGTGIGMCITANKILESVQLSAMILSLQKDQEKATMHRSCVWVKELSALNLQNILLISGSKCDFAGGGSTPKVNRINEIDAEYKKIERTHFMNRIYNNPDYMVEDMTKGFLKANKDLIAETENPQVVKYKKTPVPNKVGIVTGGGSGHKPAFIGYVGENLCDAAAIGQIFSSPTAKAFFRCDQSCRLWQRCCLPVW